MAKRFLTLLLILFAAPATAQDNLLSGKALADALRAGGYVIYFRHARTDWSQRDEKSEDLNDCKLQRNLSAEGRADSKLIGEGVKAVGLPLGRVVSSPYCRCREHAEIAFGRVETLEEIAQFLGQPEHRDRRTAALRRLLNEKPAQGNTVIVGHQASLRAAVGIALDEGEAIIFRQGAELPIMIGRIKPGGWAALAQAR
jgi:broad specificity phosphatase PhoE